MRSGCEVHATYYDAYCLMLAQIARDYPGVNALLLKAHQIRFFYEYLKPELLKHG